MRYLKGTSKTYLCYGSGDPVLQIYTDADMMGDVNTEIHIRLSEDIFRGSSIVAIEVTKVYRTVIDRGRMHCHNGGR